ncbi:MAG: alpha/beta hydrolase [Chitinophagaceae bacterium]|nr:MAG: alpha/beta hydrolase [Chitinophagaceae bacterium]
MNYNIKTDGKFNYIEEGEGPTIVLLHGLFGALSNFAHVLDYFTPKMKVCIPLLPLFDLPLNETSVIGMVKHIEEFLEKRGYDDVIVLGNSLGGHIALLFTLQNMDKVRTMVLTGSSGLFESALGDTYPKKSDYTYIKDKTEYTFYDPKTATKALVDEVYEIVNNRNKAIRVIYLAKSAMRHNLKDDLPKITTNTLLIWGKNDRITPPFVAEEFLKQLPNAQLDFINQCGHAAMMEKPDEFNKHLEDFLVKHNIIKP